MGLRRVLMAAVTATVLSSCAAGPALFGSTGHVAGRVMERACGGALREGQSPCQTSPVSGMTLTFSLNGSSDQASAKTDASGSYGIDLRPGRYTVELAIEPSDGHLPPTRGGPAGPKTVIVTSGKTVTADFVYTIDLL